MQLVFGRDPFFNIKNEVNWQLENRKNGLSKIIKMKIRKECLMSVKQENRFQSKPIGEPNIEKILMKDPT